MREGGGSAALAAFEDFPLRHVRPSPLARSAASESQPQHQSPSPGPPLPPSTSFTSRAELVFGSLRPASPSPSGDSAPGRLHGGTGTAPGVEGVPGDPAAEAKSEGAPSWYVSGLAKQPPKAPARVRGPWTVETPVAEPGDGLGVAGGGVHASGGLGSGALVLRQGEGEEEGEEDEEELRSCGWRRRGAGDREGGGFLAESSVMSQKAERQQVAGMVGKDDTLDGEEEEDEFDLFAEGVLPQSARENELVQVSRSGWAGNFSKEVEQVQKILGRMGGEPGGEGRTERWRQGWRVEDRLRVDREGAARRLAEDRASFPPLPSPTQRRELLHPNSGAPPSISPVAGEGKLSSVHLVELTEAMQDSSKGKPVGSGNSVSTELADGSVSRSTAMEGVTDAAVERVEPASGVAGDPDPVAAAAESTGADTGTVKSTGGDASPRTNDADAAHTLVQQLEQQGEQLGSAPGSTRGDGNDAGTDESCRKRRSLSRLSRDSSTATGAAAKATTDSPLVSMGTLSWPTRMSQPFLSSSTRQPRSAAPRSSILESPAGNSDKAGDGTMGTAQGVEEDQSLVSSTRGVARVQQMTGIHAPAGEGESEEAGPREKEPDGRVGAAEVQPEKGSPSAGRERRLLRGILKRKAAGEQGRERGEEGGVVLGGEGAGRRRRVRFRGMEEGKGEHLARLCHHIPSFAHWHFGEAIPGSGWLHLWPELVASPSFTHTTRGMAYHPPVAHHNLGSSVPPLPPTPSHLRPLFSAPWWCLFFRTLAILRPRGQGVATAPAPKAEFSEGISPRPRAAPPEVHLLRPGLVR